MPSFKCFSIRLRQFPLKPREAFGVDVSASSAGFVCCSGVATIGVATLVSTTLSMMVSNDTEGIVAGFCCGTCSALFCNAAAALRIGAACVACIDCIGSGVTCAVGFTLFFFGQIKTLLVRKPTFAASSW